MAVHFGAPFGDLALLRQQLFGLLGQPGRGGVHLAGLLIHFGLTTLQATFVLAKGLAHAGNLALPIDQLLAKTGDRQPMFFPSVVQGQGLLAGLVGFRLNVGAEHSEVFLTLVNIRMNLAQVTTKMFASPPNANGPTNR